MGELGIRCGLVQIYEIHEGRLGPPLLAGALGWIECRLASEHATGDHTFFVGEVASAERGPGTAALVHVRQTYL